jgi:steroid delta-isomerase-like uncharacterized protein
VNSPIRGVGEMASGNVEAVRNTVESFNRRDFVAAVKDLAEDAVFIDHGQNVTLKGPEQVKGWNEEWAKAFSDGKVEDIRLIDGGDKVTLQFVGRGTNDGPLGSLPATNRRAEIPFCEVYDFDSGGKIVKGEAYYDMLSFMVQLGHAEPPPRA